jgi:hypothetical protein
MGVDDGRRVAAARGACDQRGHVRERMASPEEQRRKARNDRECVSGLHGANANLGMAGAVGARVA